GADAARPNDPGASRRTDRRQRGGDGVSEISSAGPDAARSARHGDTGDVLVQLRRFGGVPAGARKAFRSARDQCVPRSIRAAPARGRRILQPLRDQEQPGRILDRGRGERRGGRAHHRGGSRGHGMAAGSLSYDAVVVGGGAAGLAAAVAAARAGARTALVERYGFLGGMATAGMVSTICGLYHTSSSGPPEPLNAGFAETVAPRLAAMPGCSAPVRRGRTHVLPYTPFAFACLADELTRAAPALDVYLHPFLADVETGSGRIATLRLATWE